jgi:hypothetical protein
LVEKAAPTSAPKQGEPMNHWHREPTITEILSDSIVRSLMQADGVDPDELEATLKHMAGAQTTDRWRRFRVGCTSPDKIGQECP